MRMRTLELTDEAIAVSTQYSFALGLAWATILSRLGVGRNWAGGRARQVTTRAFRYSGHRWQVSITRLHLALLAEIYLRNNRIDEGLAAIEEAQKLAVTGGELFWHAELLRLKGELLLGQSDPSVQAAEECLCEALKIAQDQHAKMLELRAATSLAKLWRKLNKLDDAKRILNSVYSRFTEGIDNRDLIEAKTVLDQLNV